MTRAFVAIRPGELGETRIDASRVVWARLLSGVEAPYMVSVGFLTGHGIETLRLDVQDQDQARALMDALAPLTNPKGDDDDE